MDKKLCLHVCYAYLPEVRHILGSGDYPDVRVTGDSLNCLTAYRDPVRISKQEGHCPENDTQVIFIGSSCIRKHLTDKSGKHLAGFHQLDYCHELILCKELVDYYCQRRYYLVSGGWLANYRKHIADWGFDADSAKAFFAGSSDKILFLDTGIMGDCRQELTALSDFMGLPYETLPIGLSHCRNLIDSLVFKWRENKERTQLNDQIARIAEKAADYSLVFEQMQRLVDLTNEDEIVSEVFQLLNLLFAPENIRYQPVDSKQRRQELCYKQEPDAFSDPTSISLIIEARNQGEVLGSFTLAGLGYPEYLEQYKPMRRVIGGLGGLAIANARKFKAIQENEVQLLKYTTELQAANASKDKFFSIIAHDLKNPMGAFLGLTELMADEDYRQNPDEMRKTASVVHQSAMTLYRLLENLLEWSKVQMTGIHVNVTLLDLAAVVVPEIGMIRSTARITVDSTVGRGSKFAVILPVIAP